MYNYGLLFLAAAFIVSSCFGDDKLLSVVVIYRHGARTPINPYPNDPYKNASFWPVGFGQLTNEGKEQQYQLGQWFRQRYTGFLPAQYYEKDIYVRSTDVDRTLMSAESNLAGLYPPQQEFHPDLHWQPIPVHSFQDSKDEVLAMKRPCKNYDTMFQDLFKQPFFLNLSHTYHDLYAYLTRYSGLLVNNPDEVEYLYNTLTIEKSYNYTLPNWTENVYPKKMEYLASLSFALDTFTPELARLKTGPLFHLITKHFKNASKRSYESEEHKPVDVLDRKFLMFSAHDTTVANVLNTMGLFDMHCPPFAATVIFELRQRTNKTTYLNIFYKNSTNPTQLNMKYCGFDCDLNKFEEILKPIIIDQKTWEYECVQDWMDVLLPLGNHRASSYFTFAIFFAVIVGLCLVIVKTCERLFAVKPNKAHYEQLPN